LHSSFAETWRVRQGYSIFYQSTLFSQYRATDQAFPINWSGDYATNYLIDPYCASIIPATTSWYPSASTFFQRACTYDMQSFGDSTPSVRALQFVCLIYCQLGQMPTALVNATDCSYMCVFDDFTSKMELHVPYTINNLPAVQIAGKDQPLLMFKPEQHLGGEFLMQLEIADLCGTYKQNVSLNIVCLNPLSVSAQLVTAQPITYGPYGYPEVWVQGLVSSSLPTTYSWKFVQTPTPLFGSQNLTHFRLSPNSRSLMAYFIPTYAGTYVLEFAASDGCAIRRYNLTINVNCGRCTPAPAITGEQRILYNTVAFAPLYNMGPIKVRRFYFTPSVLPVSLFLSLYSNFFQLFSVHRQHHLRGRPCLRSLTL
jgi:hypothetical protein